jgi:hypothetical protein
MKKLQIIGLLIAIVVGTAGLIVLQTGQAEARTNLCSGVNCNQIIALCQSDPGTYCSHTCTWAGQARYVCPQSICPNNNNPWCTQ